MEKVKHNNDGTLLVRSDEVNINIVNDNNNNNNNINYGTNKLAKNSVPIINNGNEKSTKSSKSRYGRLVNHISVTVKEKILRLKRQYSGTSFGMEFSGYYLNEGIIEYIFKYFTQRELHFICQVSKTIMTLIYKHPQIWENYAREEYFIQLHKGHERQIRAKNAFFSEWPEYVYRDSNGGFETFVKFTWFMFYIILAGIVIVVYFIHDKIVLTTFCSIALCTTCGLLALYFMYPFIFNMFYHCKLILPNSDKFNHSRRNHGKKLKDNAYYSFDPTCSSALSYYYKCKCFKYHFRKGELFTLYPDNARTSSAFYTMLVGFIVISIIGIVLFHFNENASKVNEPVQYLLPYFAPLIYLICHFAFINIYKFVKDAFRRREQILIVFVAWAGTLFTITMLMIPSIPW